MTNSGPEYDPAPDFRPDEATDPDPKTLAGGPSTLADLDTYEEAGPGAPTAEDLAADDNLYPKATGDDVPDGSQLATADDLPEESSDLNDV